MRSDCDPKIHWAQSREAEIRIPLLGSPCRRRKSARRAENWQIAVAPLPAWDLRLQDVHAREAASDARVVDGESGRVAGPAGAAGGVHEGDADGGVGERVGEAGDFCVGFVGHFDPRALESERVEVAGLDFVELHGVNLCKTAHHFQQVERAEAGVFAARGPDDGSERVVAVKFDDVHVVARLGAGAEGEGFVRRDVEKVEPAAEQRILFHGEESEGGVGGPVYLDVVLSTEDAGFSKGVGFFPVPNQPRNLVSGSAQRGDIGFAGTGDVLRGFVENVEVVAVSRGVGGGVGRESACEMTEFISVRGDDAEDFALEGRYRHEWSRCASRHARCPPYSRRFRTTRCASSTVSIAAARFQNQKHSGNCRMSARAVSAASVESGVGADVVSVAAFMRENVSALRNAGKAGLFGRRETDCGGSSAPVSSRRMSWRFHEHILRGELDNSVRGRVTGRIWLAGVAEPLVLDLAGDGAPDLAGCVLSFENPAPVAMNTRPPAAQQRGVAGEITAARKGRVFDVPLDQAFGILDSGGQPPAHVANALVIEWFSPRCGGFRFETTEFRLTVSGAAWRFTAAEIAERERRIEEEMTDFEQALRADDAGGEWDEFRNEQLLRQSDTMNERCRRLYEEHGREDIGERIVAHLMGWETIAEYLAEKMKTGRDPLAAADDANDEDEDGADGSHFFPDDAADYEEPEPDPAREGIDWVRDKEERIVHPIYKAARDLCSEAMGELKKPARLFTEGEDEAASEFVGQMMTLSAKLAGALGGLARDGDLFDPSFTVATLKRVLGYHNAALTAVAALDGSPLLAADRVAHYRAGLFKIREEIVALIARLRGER